MDSRRARALRLAGILFVLAVPCPASWGEAREDMVVLRTGEIFSGKILRANSEEVSVKLDSGGVMSFRAHRVERVVRGGSVIRYNGSSPVVETPPPPETGEREEPPAVRPRASDLASFPLYAERSGPVAGSKDDPPGSRFTDSTHKYSLTPPPGFRSWNSDLPLVHRAFRHPAMLANLTISCHESEEGLESIKNNILGLLARRKAVKLIRQAPQSVPGARNGEGWLVEMEDSSSKVPIRQLQLLTKKGRKFFVITYSAAAKQFSAISRGLEDSARSFRFEVSPGDEEADRDEIPPEVQAYLRKKAGLSSGPPPSRIDPNAFRPDSGRLIDKVDQRLRGAPLQGYPVRP